MENGQATTIGMETSVWNSKEALGKVRCKGIALNYTQ